MSLSVAAAGPVALNLLDPHSRLASAGALGEIGRASCRERVFLSV